jgi:hypothetical protein
MKEKKYMQVLGRRAPLESSYFEGDVDVITK